MGISENKTVAEIVTENIKTADVFKKHGIDFCCGGGISIEKACSKNGVNYSDLESDLNAVETTNSAAYNYDSWDLGFLIDHITNIHHTYVEQQIPIILEYAQKVSDVHGHHHEEVVKINELFKEVAAELTAHMKKEELILFPYVKQLANAVKESKSIAAPDFGTVNDPIAMMEQEHETAGDIFKEIAKLSNNYTPPEEACNTFKALYASLDAFEQDLHQHIHLENNIVFPKSKKMEQ
ncbi:MAG: iron-sulfur cluster repair di-iron protein [Flavobacteriaceae bacterium]|nr:iron-sulfur cluster repair di-iron protein [Flavobacteriaceae bacterium]